MVDIKEWKDIMKVKVFRCRIGVDGGTFDFQSEGVGSRPIFCS
jgi:hypothetical protein